MAHKGDGPRSTSPGQGSRYREVCELKSTDHKVYTTSLRGPGGKWLVIFKIDFRSKK